MDQKHRHSRIFQKARLVFLLFSFCLTEALLIFKPFNVLAQSKTPGITVSINPANGNYTIRDTRKNWDFEGSTGHQLSDIKHSNGSDDSGPYHAVSFRWKADHLYRGTIQWYDKTPVIIFSLTSPQKAEHIAANFPSFNQFPQLAYHYSFADDVFSPHQFKLNETSTPWMFFNADDNAFIISPASDFIVSKMTGNGQNEITSGLNPELQNLPAGFTHKTILVMDEGIHNAWTVWGNALMKMYHKIRPANDADKVLKYFGYWTDNGADYYYNYDTTLGYSKTLLKVRQRYQEENIPLGYMQLDSWWYEKSIDDPDGRPDADHKNPNLPYGEWNRYGGLLSYTADKFLFPNGLAAFHEKLGLPLVTHNRWVDPKSPYRKKYKISGYAATDPGYWKEIIGYIHHAGVICYEQDWLNYIYNKSPEMASDLSVGNAFTDGMANACKADGLDMQYCMAMPRFFMQGVKYNNLTTIRTSDDRFEPRKWSNFVYTTQLGFALGIWPWCDVFKSHETGNMVLSVLSAGAVGTGDAIGKEDKHNIMMSCRADGILIKPDVAIVPMDISYITNAQNIDKPTLAFTYTKHNNITTNYVFAFSEKGQQNEDVDFKPSQLNMKGEVVIYNSLSGEIKKQQADETFNSKLGADHYAYFMIVPVMPCGIAFLGEENKIVGTGKKRIAEMKASGKTLQVEVLFAKGEDELQLHGYYTHSVKSDKGKLILNEADHTFSLTLPASKNGDPVNLVLTGDL